MARCHSLWIGLMAAGATSALSLPGQGNSPAGTPLASTAIRPTSANRITCARELAGLPLSFESNQGQTDGRVRFLTHRGDTTLFLTPSEAVFTMPTPSIRPYAERSALWKDRKEVRAEKKRARVALRMRIVGANPQASAWQQHPLEGRVNYFVGNDPRKWHANIPTFERVGFHQIYAGIDLVYYGNQRHLEYDFVVAPHADPRQIQLRFAGAQGVHVNAAGDLVVRIQGRELKWRKPAVYQQKGIEKQVVPARFQVKRLPNGRTGVRFALGRYDTARPLVIDPVLLYSTFLGGTSDSNTESLGYAIAVDSSGNTYVAGHSSTPDFPTTSGAYQATSPGPVPAFVTKLNAAGTALLYSTFLGGNMGGSGATGIAVDAGGSAYVTGHTSDVSFPTTPGAFQTVNIGQQGFAGFVTKIDPTGASLVYSTFLGGSKQDLTRGIAVDSSNNAYVVGRTNSADFPTTPGAFQTVYTSQGSGNAFVTKFNATGAALVYSTYLGGSGRRTGEPGTNKDDAYSVAVDSSGSAYVTGETSSLDFPITPGVFQPTNHRPDGSSASNGFVTKLNPTGTGLIYSTFIGGSGTSDPGVITDAGYGIAIDSSGDAYITGIVSSPDFPTTPGAFQRIYTSRLTGFVAKLNATATGLVYSTLLGGSRGGTMGTVPYTIAVDSSGDACVAGTTDFLDFPTTAGAFQRAKSPLNLGVGFVTKLNASGTNLLYSTLLGGKGAGASSTGDVALGIALDSNGNAYVTGQTSSPDFPITPGAFQTINHPADGLTGFVVKLSPIPIFPDFNNDGKTDLLIQNSSTNVIANWFMNGSTWIGGAYFSLTPPLDYALVGTGDFSGDGKTTLVLQSSVSNQIAFWYTNGANNATIPGGNFINTTPPTGWKVVGVGDFNADGKSDLVLQNQTTNQVAIWFMNGYLYNGGVLMPYTPPTGWTVAGAGDFNGDGFADLVFQSQTSGQIALWYMNGPTYANGTVLTTTPATGWKIVGVGDYNGDGSADLLFQNQTNNQAAVWYLKNGAYVGGNALSLAPPPGWKIVGPR